jgi:hypothetical protein
MAVNDLYILKDGNVTFRDHVFVETRQDDGGALYKWIESVAIFNKNGFDWGKLKAITPETFNTPSVESYSKFGSLETWMGQIPDATPLSRVSIPGTHESMTYGFTPNQYDAKKPEENTTRRTQDLSLLQQLKYGVRYFDIRINTNNQNKLMCVHGQEETEFAFADALDIWIGFCISHPNETYILRLASPLKDEDKKKEKILRTNLANMAAEQLKNLAARAQYQLQEMDDALARQLKKNAENIGVYQWTNKPVWPTLDKCRGKIVLLNNLGADATESDFWRDYSIAYPSMDGEKNCIVTTDTFYVQDDYLGPTVDKKKDEIKAGIKACTAAKDDKRLYINHVSATRKDSKDAPYPPERPQTPKAFADILNKYTTQEIIIPRRCGSRVGAILFDYVHVCDALSVINLNFPDPA